MIWWRRRSLSQFFGVQIPSSRPESNCSFLFLEFLNEQYRRAKIHKLRFAPMSEDSPHASQTSTNHRSLDRLLDRILDRLLDRLLDCRQWSWAPHPTEIHKMQRESAFCLKSFLVTNEVATEKERERQNANKHTHKTSMIPMFWNSIGIILDEIKLLSHRSRHLSSRNNTASSMVMFTQCRLFITLLLFLVALCTITLTIATPNQGNNTTTSSSSSLTVSTTTNRHLRQRQRPYHPGDLTVYIPSLGIKLSTGLKVKILARANQPVRLHSTTNDTNNKCYSSTDVVFQWLALTLLNIRGMNCTD